MSTQSKLNQNTKMEQQWQQQWNNKGNNKGNTNGTTIILTQRLGRNEWRW
jgi:hypothetical protein